MEVVLTIAGSDSSGGAGIQADLKTFEAFGVFGTSVITVLTAQNTTGVRSIYPVEPQFIKEQIQAVLEDFDVKAIKIGMLLNKQIILTIKDIIKELYIPIVLDPVFISKAGSPLLDDDAIESMKELFEYVELITPNQFEANALFGYKFGDSDSLKPIFEAPCKVLIKNQIHTINEKERSFDTLHYGRDKQVFDTPYLESNNTHGTGCSFSSAIAANLALGHNLTDSIKISKQFIYEAIKNAPNIGAGKGPIAHKTAGELCKN